MTLQEQINQRISNYKTTMTGIQDGKTEWHTKQIKSLQEKIDELEWVLRNINTCVDNSDPEFETNFIKHLENENHGISVFQKNEDKTYFYISENGKHGVSLEHLLKQFKQYLVALSA